MELINKDNLGITSSGLEYQNIKNNQDPLIEFYKTRKFLREVIIKELLIRDPELGKGNVSLEFINYGDTEQVYVLHSVLKKYTILVGQPAMELGIVRKEYEHLKRLAQDNPGVVINPKYYFSNNEREMYVTPYIYQARCIASQNSKWGVYIPEPYYRFERFSDQERNSVNIAMIANLVRLYDCGNNMGLASCKLGGGDFVLEKEWSSEDKSLESTLNHMKLIAAREMISIPFDEYIDLLRREFVQRTYCQDIKGKDSNILINHKSRVPMELEEIEKGIELGRRLKNK